MIRKHKKYSWPRKLYDAQRIKDEDKLVEMYGLKNKREIWKAEAKVRYLRTRAKDLITSGQDEQQAFFMKLNKLGLNVHSIADVLALTKEDVLKRRLSTVLVSKGIAATARQARQMIAHKRIAIDGSTVSAPSYLVPVAEENLIALSTKAKKVAAPAAEATQ